jgi:hypothetical protein
LNTIPAQSIGIELSALVINELLDVVFVNIDVSEMGIQVSKALRVRIVSEDRLIVRRCTRNDQKKTL